MSPPLRDSHALLGVPVGAARHEVQLAFRREMRLRIDRREQADVAFEIVALQRAYWEAIATARSDRLRPKPLWQALFLAGVLLLAAFVFTTPFPVMPPSLRTMLGAAGVLALLLSRVRRRLGPDKHEFLENDVLELLAIRTPQHYRPYEPPFAVEAPTEGVWLAAAVARVGERDERRVVFARGTRLPTTATLEVTLPPDGKREIALEFVALETAGDAGRPIQSFRVVAPRPLRKGELAVEISAAASGALSIAARDLYADRQLRVEGAGDANVGAPVSTSGYRG